MDATRHVKETDTHWAMAAHPFPSPPAQSHVCSQPAGWAPQSRCWWCCPAAGSLLPSVLQSHLAGRAASRAGPSTSGRPRGGRVFAQQPPRCCPPSPRRAMANRSGCEDSEPWRKVEAPPGESGGGLSGGMENCSRPGDRSRGRAPRSDEPVGAVAGLVTLWLGSRGSPGEREM